MASCAAVPCRAGGSGVMAAPAAAPAGRAGDIGLPCLSVPAGGGEAPAMTSSSSDTLTRGDVVARTPPARPPPGPEAGPEAKVEAAAEAEAAEAAAVGVVGGAASPLWAVLLSTSDRDAAAATAKKSSASASLRLPAAAPSPAGATASSAP